MATSLHSCFPDLRLVAVLLLHLLSSPSQVAAGNNLTAGGTLTPPGYITSPSGVFAFGFRALDSDPSKFLLATWFRSGNSDDSSQQPPQSVVWFAKQSPSGATAFATAQSLLSVSADGAVTLTDGGNQPLWNASTSSSNNKRQPVLALADSGNLRLLNGDGTVLWESFWYPTDTLLPGQSLVLDDRSQGKLFAKRADAEFTTGRFGLFVQADGNVVLYIDLLSGTDSRNAYWAAKTDNPNGINTTVTFDERGWLNYTLSNGTVQSLITPASTSAPGAYFHFARMDPDGIVRTYVRSKNNGGNTTWFVSGAFPSDGCNKRTSGLQGMCGPGSFCVETKDRLRCECPTGYNYTDAQHADSGCTPAFEPQSCGGGGEDSFAGDFTLQDLQNVTWEASIYYKKLSVTEDECRANCLADCFCAAALVVGDGSECIEVAALTNGRRGNDVTTKALIKVRTGGGRTRPTTRNKSLGPYRILTVCLAFLLAVTVGGSLAHHYISRNSGESQRLLLTSSSVRAFTWKELHQATNGFEKLLGKGSFGEVYKGIIRSPQPQVIAVKKLMDSNEYTEKEFTNEVQSIGQIHHRNLVRMLGYCKEGNHRMLVFEFMPGGSLRNALFNVQQPPPWPWRAEAALAIARGLEYLHDGCSAPIIHCDIKPDNILIDGHGVPRITDFGISKLLGSHQVHATVTNVRGTRGYIAPEWLRGDARVDTMADVYSFGVMLLEMICCRKCQEPVETPNGEGTDDNDETVTLFGWAAQLLSARRIDQMLLHHDAVDAMEDLEQVERFARVAFWCMEPNPTLRPTMHQVVHMLETTDQAQAIPDPPGCYMESSPLIPLENK